jgi:hypothetical protein
MGLLSDHLTVIGAEYFLKYFKFLLVIFGNFLPSSISIFSYKSRGRGQMPGVPLPLPAPMGLAPF